MLIKNDEIKTVERILLPEGCRFSDDAKVVINHWSSTDVVACPGSGKTTVLLAKLKLLADRMPLPNGAGVCVLSHTNVAVNEIKMKISDCAEKLMNYPNFVGTIQSFVDQFVAIPHLKRKHGLTVRPVDDRTYAEHLCHIIYSGKHPELKYCVKNNYDQSDRQYKDRADHVSKLYLREDGALCMRDRRVAIASSSRQSAQQFQIALQNMLSKQGLIKYSEAFHYANEALDNLIPGHTDLFSSRFQYVFIDEYQDCNKEQRSIVQRIFDSTKCCVINIGDSDQAIYNSYHENTPDWLPQDGHLSIESTNRYGQEIADVLKPLRRGKTRIISSHSLSGYKPVLIVYNLSNISLVLGEFINQLNKHELIDKNGIYKAVGHIRKEDTAGISIGSYWSEFDGSDIRSKDSGYWTIVDEICQKLNEGKSYLVEPLIRKLIGRLFHYAGIMNTKSNKAYSMLDLKQMLDNDCFEIYRNTLKVITEFSVYNRESIDIVFRQLMDKLASSHLRSAAEIYRTVPAYFMQQSTNEQLRLQGANIFVDPIYGRCIHFTTVHGVKGETHDATLYLETDFMRSSDIVRILPYLGIGSLGTSQLYNYSRKMVYVGMSRPRKLLCVAIKDTTFNRGRGAFENWRIVRV